MNFYSQYIDGTCVSSVQELDRRFKAKGLMASAVSLHPGGGLFSDGKDQS